MIATLKSDSPHFSGALILPRLSSSRLKYSRVPSTWSISGLNANRMNTNPTIAVSIVSGISRISHVENRNS